MTDTRDETPLMGCKPESMACPNGLLVWYCCCEERDHAEDREDSEELADYEHDTAFFLRLMVANTLAVYPPEDLLDDAWVVRVPWGTTASNHPMGEGPDPIHAALDWLEKAHAAGIAIKWSVE